MAYAHGIKIHCDRCENNLFINTDLSSNERSPDGTYTPDQHGYIIDWMGFFGWEIHEGMDLCPECAREFHKIFDTFKQKNINNQERRDG